MNDFEWSKAEKQAARRAFDLALKRECLAIRGKLEQMLKADEDFRQIWRIHDYLSEKRREVDLKYDYRYSRLITVFGRLLMEGWIAEADLGGLAEDKLQRIKGLASFMEQSED
jgi:hypothetical protein